MARIYDQGNGRIRPVPRRRNNSHLTEYNPYDPVTGQTDCCCPPSCWTISTACCWRGDPRNPKDQHR